MIKRGEWQRARDIAGRVIRPQQVKTNTDTALIKWIALFAMCCDHAGKMLFPQWPFLRMIGRLAFPLYAYCAAVGMVFTRRPARYIARMGLLALVSQPLYALALAHTTPRMFSVPFGEQPLRAAWNFYIYSWNKPSILLTLVCGLCILMALREKNAVFLAVSVALCVLLQEKLDYGWRGIVLMTLFYTLCEFPGASFCAVGAYLIWWGLRAKMYTFFGWRYGLQMYALPAMALIYWPVRTRCRMPKWLGYAFYPLHLLLLIAALAATGYWA